MLMPSASSTARPAPDDPHDCLDRQARRRGRAGPSQAARRCCPIPGDHLPIRAESRQGHALQLDAQSLSRLYARLPLLLRAAYQTQFELGPGDEFSSLIFVKVNLVEVLRRELDRPSWTREPVAVGTATDPYQPIEGHYKLTRRSLEALLATRTPDRPRHEGSDGGARHRLLVELGRRTGCTVCVSVPTVDEEAWARARTWHGAPDAAAAGRAPLREAGVNAGVLMAPVVPGFTTQPARLEATIKAIAEHGAAFMGANVMYLKGGTRDHFLHFVSEQFPERLEGYRRMYPGAYAPKPTWKQSAG